MQFIDTHTHIYLEQFNDDRKETVQRAVDSGVSKLLLPNIDSNTIEGMHQMEIDHPGVCYAMMGLHPTHVKENYKKELKTVEDWLSKRKYIAIGEIGIDLYWDKAFYKQQVETFEFQCRLAVDLNLPVVIHARESYKELFESLENMKLSNLRGVFHAFTGHYDEANKLIDLGFMVGIGGIVTFKNSGLGEVVKGIDLEHILLETDSPFLAPTPNRGKRNESSYVKLVAQKIADVKEISLEKVAEATTQNAKKLFSI